MSQSRICAEEGFAQVQRLEAKDLRLSWNWLRLGLWLTVELQRAYAKAQIPKDGLVEQTSGAQNYPGLNVLVKAFLNFFELQSSNDYELERHDP